jgi:hypothetical protein
MAAISLLVGLVLLTIAATVADRVGRRREQCVYRKLAADHGMHYSPGDPLRVTPRVAGHLPIPGAAAVRVIDLMYRTDESTHHYVFTAEYTIGTMDARKRVRRVATWREPKSMPEAGTGAPVRVADDRAALAEQYRQMLGGQVACAIGD